MPSTKWRAVAQRSAHLLRVTLPAFGGRGVQFLALAAMAAVVSPADYGRFSTLQVLVLGLASITASSMGASSNAAAARATRDGALGVWAILATLLRARRRALLVNLVVSSLAVPVGYFLVVGVTPERLPMLVAIGVMSAALPVGETVVAVLAGSGRYRTASWTDAVRAVAGAALALVLGVVSGPWWATVGLLATDVLIAVAAIVLATNHRRATTTLTGLAGPAPAAPDRSADGLHAGLVANVLGQVANWVVLWAIGATGGALGLGAYGVALRFASVVTLAPVYFGKTVIGQLAAPGLSANQWTPRSFVGMLAGLSVVGSLLAAGVMALGFPSLPDRYDGLWWMLAAVLTATSLRAVLIGLGQVCVAQRRWRTWVVADAASLVVTVIGVLVVFVGPTGMHGAVLVVLASAVANVAGIATRFVGLRRPTSRVPEAVR